MSLGRHALVISFFTLISRITGFVRDVIIAWFLGSSYAADAFFIAQRIPNLFRSLFAEGTFSSAFTPMFSDKAEGKDKRAATLFASQAFSGLLYALLAFTVLVEIFMPEFITLIAPGLKDDPLRFPLVISLTRITFPFLIFVSIVSVMGGMLNGVKKFGAAAATPILLNLTMIAAMYLFSHRAPEYVLSYATVAAGIIECLFIYIFIRRAKLKLGLVSPSLLKRSKDFGKFLKRLGPGVISAGIYQINLFVDTFFVSFLPQGAVSWMYYSTQLYHLPMGLIGVSIGTALLPILTKQIKAKDPKAEETAAHAVEINLYLALPAMIGLYILAEPVIRLFFERKAFTPEATIETAKILKAFIVGLPAYVLSKTFINFFFARKDTKTPAKVAGVALISNITLNAILMQFWGAVGIALATSITAYLTLFIYLALIYKKGYFRFGKSTLILIAKLILITGGTGVYLTLFPFEKGVIFFFSGVVSTMLLYLGLTVLLKAFRRNWII